MASPVEEDENPTSLHWVLKSSNYRYNDIINHIKQGFYNVEELDSERRTPLFSAIKRRNSYGIVKALLEEKACVERVDSNGRTPLIVAMENKNFSLSVVKALLFYGSKINHRSCAGHSALDTCLRLNRGAETVHQLLLYSAYVDPDHICMALQNGTSVAVLKALVSTRLALGPCDRHGTQLHCLLASPKSRSREDLLSYLLQTGANANGTSVTGQRVMCFALQNGAGLRIVKILLRAGALLDGCTRHRSTVLCITCPYLENDVSSVRPEGHVGMPLKADIVQFLVDRGYGWDLIPVVSALRYCDYDTEAIKLLLLHADRNRAMGDVIWRYSQQILERKAFASNVPPAIVKLLIEQGHLIPDGVNAADGKPSILLHRAIWANTCTPEMIKLLLKKGCSVDVRSRRSSRTALESAVFSKRNAAILNLLLMAGARIGVEGSLKPRLLQLAVRTYRCQDNADRRRVLEGEEVLKTLFKFAFLEDPGFRAAYFIARDQVSPSLLAFLKRCLAERRKMRRKVGGEGCDSLYDIVTQKQRRIQSHELDLCLRTMLNSNYFPIYQEFILSKIDRKLMIDVLQDVPVYATKTCDGMKQKHFLTYESLLAICQSLSTKDVLRFVLAYYHLVPEDKDSSDVNETIMFIANKVISNETNNITEARDSDIEEARDSDLPTNPPKKPRLEIT